MNNVLQRRKRGSRSREDALFPDSPKTRRKSPLSLDLPKSALLVVAILGGLYVFGWIFSGSSDRHLKVHFDDDLKIRSFKRVNDQPSGVFSSNKKIVALVEVRNVEPFLSFFLHALSGVVDSVAILDDHSTDKTVRVAQKLAKSCKVELIITKKGNWERREEMRDRNILLTAGRKLHGTHFVLLDYDEFFSANCVNDGSLREHILKLKPGQNLPLQWIEAWGSPYRHRVLAEDRNMNFLKRKQVVIFADDGVFNYDEPSSLSRTLGDHQSTIHTLKCPRSICATPGKSQDRSAGLQNCRIIEMKFVNLENAVLKCAWYEALGRKAGVADDVVRGKIFDVLFPSDPKASQKKILLPIPMKYVEFPFWRDELFKKLEFWRAKEILEWASEHPSGVSGLLRDLPASSTIEWSSLETALATDKPQFVSLPRVQDGSLLILIADPSVPNVLVEHVKLLLAARLIVLDDIRSKKSKLYSAADGDDEATLRRVLEAPSSGEMEENPVLLHAQSEADAQRLMKLAEKLTNIDLKVLTLVYEPPATERVNTLLNFIRVKAKENFHITAFEADASATISLSYASMLVYFLGSNSRVKWEDVIRSAMSSRQTLTDEFPDSSKPPPVARMIFSINAGRSGSLYMSDLLHSVAENIVAIHEIGCPNKECTSGGAMRMQNVTLASSYEFRNKVKGTLIIQELAKLAKSSVYSNHGTRETDELYRLQSMERFQFLIATLATTSIYENSHPIIYAETNPNFKSWFYDIVFTEFSSNFDVSVVTLRKYPPALLCSIYETGFFSSRDGYQWMETANSVNSLVPAIGPDEKLSAQQLIVSYILQTEALSQKLPKLPEARAVKFLELRSEEIFSPDGARNLIRLLNLTVSADTEEVVGQIRDKYLDVEHPLRSKASAETGAKKLRLQNITIQQCERIYDEYLNRSAILGLKMPQCVDKFPNFDYNLRQ